MHESSHTSLDSYHLSSVDWFAAQVADNGNFISDYFPYECNEVEFHNAIIRKYKNWECKKYFEIFKQIDL